MMNQLSLEEYFILWAIYVVASETAKESAKSPVIVDRCWHSTATYAIAIEVSGGLQHLPPHHSLYQ